MYTLTNSGTGAPFDLMDVMRREEQRKRSRLVTCDSYYISIAAYPKGGTYDIEISRTRTPAACLDWIHQISHKVWAWENGAQVMRDFLEVLYETIPTSFWAWKL